MKRLTSFLLLFVFYSLTLYSADDTGAVAETDISRNPENWIKTDCDIVLAVESLKTAVDAVKTVSSRFLAAEKKSDLEKAVASFEKATSYNVLSLKDIEKAGFDITRRAFMTLDYTGGKNNEITFFLPVRNSTGFPFNFIKILKKSQGFAYRSENPAVSEYEGITVYQLGNDNFFCMIGDYLVLTMSYDSLVSVIDTAKGRKDSLLKDRLYLRIRGLYLQAKENLFIRFGKKGSASVLKPDTVSHSSLLPSAAECSIGMNITESGFNASYYLSGSEDVEQLKNVFISADSVKLKVPESGSLSGVLLANSSFLPDFSDIYPSPDLADFFRDISGRIVFDGKNITADTALPLYFHSFLRDGNENRIHYIRVKMPDSASAERVFLKLASMSKTEKRGVISVNEDGLDVLELRRSSMTKLYVFRNETYIIFSSDSDVNSIINEKTAFEDIVSIRKRTGYKLNQQLFMFFIFKGNSGFLQDFFPCGMEKPAVSFEKLGSGILQAFFEEDMMVIKMTAEYK